MATIDLGRLGFVNKGTYNNSTTYEKNDLVQFTDGGLLSTYLYIDSTAQSGQAPSSSGTAGSRWVYFAKGVADAVASAGNNKVLVTNSSGNLAPVSIGSAGQFLRTNSGTNGFEFATVTSKVLGYKVNSYSGAVDKGNVNQAPSVITQLNTTYGAPVNNTSYFVVKVNLHGTQNGNHGRAYFEYSADGGSNWGFDWDNGSDGALTKSGNGITWTSDEKQKYAQISLNYDQGDPNNLSGQSATCVYQPSRPHSVSDFRVRVSAFTCSSTSSWYLNRTTGNNSTYGTVGNSSVEIWEIQA